MISAIRVPRLSSRAPRKLQNIKSLLGDRNYEVVYLKPLHFYPYATVACVECLRSWRVNVYLTHFCPVRLRKAVKLCKRRKHRQVRRMHGVAILYLYNERPKVAEVTEIEVLQVPLISSPQPLLTLNR